MVLFGGACVVLFGGAYVVLFEGCVCGFIWGGMHGFIQGGMHGFIRGACVVAPRGGMRGCSRGACMVAPGGRAWLLRGGVRGFFDEIRSMSGRYASYWNAFLFLVLFADKVPMKMWNQSGLK